MTDERKGWLRELLTWRVCTPAGFVKAAVVLSLLYLICHLAGLREYTSIMSGTMPAGGPAGFGLLFLACLYILSYVAFALLVPVLLIAALLFTLANLVWRKREPAAESPSPAASAIPQRGFWICG